MAIEQNRTFKEKAKNVVSASLVAAGMFAGGSWAVNRVADNRVHADQGDPSVIPLSCEVDEARLQVVGRVPTESGLSQTTHGVPDEVTLIFNTDGYTKTEVMRNAYYVECFDSEHPLWERPFTVAVLEPRVLVNEVTGRVAACLEEFTPESVSCFQELGPIGAWDGENTIVNWFDVPNDFPTPTPEVTATPTPTATPEFSPTPTFTPTPEYTATPTATPTPEFCDATIEVNGYVEGEVEGQGISAVAGFGVIAETMDGFNKNFVLNENGDVDVVVPHVKAREIKQVMLSFTVNEVLFDVEPSRVIEARCDENTQVLVGFDERVIETQQQSEVFLPLIRN